MAIDLIETERLSPEKAIPEGFVSISEFREEAPEWLSRHFIKTGTRLRVGPWNPAVAEEPGVVMKGDEPYLTADIWKREVPAGVVKLGPPRESDADGPVLMYGIAVQPLHEAP